MNDTENPTENAPRSGPRRTAEIIGELGPWPGTEHIHGVSFDGIRVWCAGGACLFAVDPASGEQVHTLALAAPSGTAFDGTHLWQVANDQIQKIDPRSGIVVASIPALVPGRDSGLAWADGTLWVGEYRKRTIRQIDAATGDVLRTIESDRHVTGVTWVDGELWHGTLEEGQSELRRVDPDSGAVLARVDLPPGVTVSGLESDGRRLFFCGGAASGRLRIVRKPARG